MKSNRRQFLKWCNLAALSAGATYVANPVGAKLLSKSSKAGSERKAAKKFITAQSDAETFEKVSKSVKDLADISKDLFQKTFDSSTINAQTAQDKFIVSFRALEALSSSMVIVGVTVAMIQLFNQQEDPILTALNDVDEHIRGLSDQITEMGERLELLIEELPKEIVITNAENAVSNAKDRYEQVTDWISRSYERRKDEVSYQTFLKDDYIDLEDSRNNMKRLLTEEDWLKKHIKLSYGNMGIVYKKALRIVQIYMQSTILMSLSREIKAADNYGEPVDAEEEAKRLARVAKDMEEMREKIAECIDECETSIGMHIAGYVNHRQLKEDKKKDTRQKDVKWYVNELREQYPFAEFYCAIHREGINESKETLQKQESTWCDYGTKFGGKDCDIIVRWWAGKGKIAKTREEDLDKWVMSLRAPTRNEKQIIKEYEELIAESEKEQGDLGKNSLLYLVKNNQMNQEPANVKKAAYLNTYGEKVLEQVFRLPFQTSRIRPTYDLSGNPIPQYEMMQGELTLVYVRSEYTPGGFHQDPK